jgi:dCTP deaminase
MPKGFGALPHRIIKDMSDAGFIKNATDQNIRPGSLDLTLSDEIYRVDGLLLPRSNETITDILPRINARPHSFDYPLEKDVVYIAKLKETLHLPHTVYGYCNPKSSTGRNDILVRVLADHVSRFDSINTPGYTGNLWISIIPKSFPILLQPGETLSQLRFFNQDTSLSELNLEIAFKKDSLLWDAKSGIPKLYEEITTTDYDGGIILSSELDKAIVGWECLGTNQPLDFSKRQYYSPEDFFRPLKIHSQFLLLKKNVFYILQTKEAVKVPLNMACEMIPMDERAGEFRTHYAGFIDPGWGAGQNGEGKGRPLVLEVRPFEDIVMRDAQPIAKIRFEKMAEIPEFGYDSFSDSNYSHNFTIPKLSKHFVNL